MSIIVFSELLNTVLQNPTIKAGIAVHVIHKYFFHAFNLQIKTQLFYIRKIAFIIQITKLILALLLNGISEVGAMTLMFM